MTTATSVALGGAAVSDKVRPREPVLAPTASAKSTPIKSPEKKKSKGGIESEKEPIVENLSGKFDSVADGGAGKPTAETIDLDESPMTGTVGVGGLVN